MKEKLTRILISNICGCWNSGTLRQKGHGFDVLVRSAPAVEKSSVCNFEFTFLGDYTNWHFTRFSKAPALKILPCIQRWRSFPAIQIFTTAEVSQLHNLNAINHRCKELVFLSKTVKFARFISWLFEWFWWNQQQNTAINFCFSIFGAIVIYSQRLWFVFERLFLSNV